eukprot:TRINITY_DN427_c0_g1_i2.p1 TRINITY_DN427_c0_g1~~TRINITY_DN427_c0_g1_i2.p1  ORF type:complete len:175 (-),score=8.09 TRINITY_DN427_c0_g1_i2:57-581(-)
MVPGLYRLFLLQLLFSAKDRKFVVKIGYNEQQNLFGKNLQNKFFPNSSYGKPKKFSVNRFSKSREYCKTLIWNVFGLDHLNLDGFNLDFWSESKQKCFKLNSGNALHRQNKQINSQQKYILLLFFFKHKYAGYNPQESQRHPHNQILNSKVKIQIGRATSELSHEIPSRMPSSA